MKGRSIVVHEQPLSIVAVWSGFTSLVTTLVLLLNLYLAGLLLRPFHTAFGPVQVRDAGSAATLLLPGAPAEPDYAALSKAGLLVDSPFRIAGVFQHSIIITGAYRSSPAGWAVVGLGANRLFSKQANCDIRCVWLEPGPGGSATVSQSVKWHTPGINYKPGSYLTLAVDCLFPKPVGEDGAGGALLLQVKLQRPAGNLKVSYVPPMTGWSGPAKEDAWMAEDLQSSLYSKFQAGDAQHRSNTSPLQVVAATERPHQYDPTQFSAPYRYENLYCGSPLHVLHGNLSVSAVMEWLAYHYFLFGSRSHFVLHDAGAVSKDEEMQKALEPWINLGIVTVENVENLLEFDTFYFNQNLILNDCLHKYKHQADRLWFFDVDEYILIRPPHTLQSVVTDNTSLDVLKFTQVKFSDKLCRPESGDDQKTKWNAERLFFRKPADHPAEQKYVLLNPRVMLSTGIHDPFESTHREKNRTFELKMADAANVAAYYHYHDTIMKKKWSLCTMHLPSNATKGEAETTGLASRKGLIYEWEYDDAILPQVAAAKSFIRAFLAARNLTLPLPLK